MVEHICQNCKKIFKIHTNFINHTEKRKKPCVPILENNVDFMGTMPLIKKHVVPIVNIVENIDVLEENIVKNEKKILVNRTCDYCEKVFTRGTHLRRHLTICKMKIKND